MGDIKSAREIAMEKVKELGEATDAERLRWKYVPEGKQLAGRYLKVKGYSLVTELSKYDEETKKYIVEGAGGILIRNIDLPRNEAAKRINKRVMDGIKTLKTDKVGVENIYSRIRNLFDHYVGQGEQQRKQAYASLKTEFETKAREALQQQFGSLMGMKIDVERQPQFQEEWHRLRARLDAQYLTLFEEYKQELSAIA